MSALLIAAAATVMVALLCSMRISFALMWTVQLGLIGIGLAALADQNGRDGSIVVLFVSAISALNVGYFLGRRLHRRGGARRYDSLVADSERVTVWVVGVVALATAYHFARAGVPLFSSAIERDRFDFTSSGMLGIPGRLYQYGTKIALIYAYINARARGVAPFRDRATLAACAVVAVSTLLSGFRGQALNALLLLLLIMAADGLGRYRLGTAMVRFWPAGVAGLLIFGLAAGRYVTPSASGGSFGTTLMWRLSSGAAIAPYDAMSYSNGRGFASVVAQDAHSLLLKYIGMPRASAFTFEREISSLMYHVNPASDRWAPPVTVGAIPELSVQLDGWILLVAVAGLGLLIARLAHYWGRSILSATWAVTLAYAGYTFIIRGGLVYQVVNWLAVLVLVTGIRWLVARAVGDAPAGDERQGGNETAGDVSLAAGV